VAVVSNSSPLIALAEISQLDLLHRRIGATGTGNRGFSPCVRRCEGSALRADPAQRGCGLDIDERQGGTLVLPVLGSLCANRRVADLDRASPGASLVLHLRKFPPERTFDRSWDSAHHRNRRMRPFSILDFSVSQRSVRGLDCRVRRSGVWSGRARSLAIPGSRETPLPGSRTRSPTGCVPRWPAPPRCPTRCRDEGQEA